VLANYVPEASVIRGARTLPSLIGRKEMRRLSSKFLVKASGLTGELLGKLPELRKIEANGIPGGAVECVDTRRNTSGKGGSLCLF
jgi:hypothetical protein